MTKNKVYTLYLLGFINMIKQCTVVLNVLTTYNVRKRCQMHLNFQMFNFTMTCQALIIASKIFISTC